MSAEVLSDRIDDSCICIDDSDGIIYFFTII